jgi:hypothetical protein
MLLKLHNMGHIAGSKNVILKVMEAGKRIVYALKELTIKTVMGGNNMSTYIYILIIVSHVHNGTMVSQQEYANKASCENAAVVVKGLQNEVGTFYKQRTATACVPKWESK